MGLADACVRLDCREIKEDKDTRKKCIAVSCCGFVVFIIALSLILHATIGGRVYLKDDEQLLLKKRTSRSVENGPATVYYNPFTTSATKRNGIVLSATEYLHVANKLTGEARKVEGPQLFFLDAHDEAVEPMPKQVIRANQYLVVLDSTSGEARVIRGPATFAPSPREDMDLPVRDAFQLMRNEYIKLVDSATGAVRLEIGEQLVFPTATEAPGEVRAAVKVDSDTAALVREPSGQQRLVTPAEHAGLFFPAAHEEIIEERPLILVHPHEVAIVQDNQGVYTFHAGNGSSSVGGAQGTSFFLHPYHHLVVMYWTSDDGSGEKDEITKIDMRASYLPFDFGVRTSDNVQLNLVGNIFWQIEDAAKMIEMTADPRADVNNHARSTLQEEVSKVTLEKFMDDFSSIVKVAAERDSRFYEMRGVKLHSLEVTGYTPTDEETAATLQEIIKQTTDRINRLQKQRSDNEVQQEQIANDLVLEQARQALVTKQNENARLTALAEQQKQNEVEQSKVAAEAQLEQARADLVSAQAANQKALALAAQQLENEVIASKLTAEVANEQIRKELVAAKAEIEKLSALAVQAQADAVDRERLTSQVEIETLRQQLVTAKATNDVVEATATGESIGVNWAKRYHRFLQELGDSNMDELGQLELFKFLSEQDATTRQIEASSSNLGRGSAQLYLTPQEANLKLNVGTFADGSTTSPRMLSPSPSPPSGRSSLPLYDASSGSGSGAEDEESVLGAQ